VKLFSVSGTAGYIAAKGLPFPELLAVAAGLVEVIGGLLVVIGWQTRLAATALLLFTAAAAFLFHDFWNLPAGPERVAQMVHAWKNLSIIGGLMVLAAAGAGRWSLDGRR
jgi:putative oxidoreductase